MALQTATPPTAPSAQVVGNAFVEQYYHILHHSPDLVYRFYQDSSVISRPDSNGVMTSVTTMKVSFFDTKLVPLPPLLVPKNVSSDALLKDKKHCKYDVILRFDIHYHSLLTNC